MLRDLIIIGDTDGGCCQWKDVEHVQREREQSGGESSFFIRMPGGSYGSYRMETEKC